MNIKHFLLLLNSEFNGNQKGTNPFFAYISEIGFYFTKAVEH